MPDGERSAQVEWGRVPEPILEMLSILSEKAARDSRHLQRMKWPDGPQDVQDLLGRAISDAHKVTKASSEIRSLLSAYAHHFHQPRPVLADLARAQGTTSQGFVRRYSDLTVRGIEALLSTEPDIELVRKAFPSASLSELAKLNGAVGQAAERLINEKRVIRSSTQLVGE